jgi:BMFP domain-containing protein YqiC
MLFSQLSQTLFNELRQAVPSSVSDLPEQEFRALIESLLRKMNLVSRDEFDAQQAVLQRTRSKLEALEQELAQLQESLAQDKNAD